MINVIATPTPTPLGDTIDMVLFCHMLSKHKNEKVNLRCDKNSIIKYFRDLIDLGEVTINSDGQPSETITYKPGFDCIPVYSSISKHISNIKTNKQIPSFKIDLPESFITVQWDAAQDYRKVDRWDKNRIKNLEGLYKNQKYDIIDIGHRKYTAEQCAYIISKAQLHVGADSGMMHIAKLVLPIDHLHMYINIRKRENDKRFPDEWNVAFMARELFRRGVKMNPLENPGSAQIDYFKDTTKWAGVTT